MKRLLLLCLMMVLAMAMFASHKRVSASVVNMRAEGSKNAQIVAKLSKGDVVEILQAGNWDSGRFTTGLRSGRTCRYCCDWHLGVDCHCRFRSLSGSFVGRQDALRLVKQQLYV